MPLWPGVTRVALGMIRRAGACSRVGVSGVDDLKVLKTYG